MTSAGDEAESSVVGPAQIQQARERLEGIVFRTPAVPAGWTHGYQAYLDGALGNPVPTDEELAEWLPGGESAPLSGR